MNNADNQAFIKTKLKSDCKPTRNVTKRVATRSITKPETFMFGQFDLENSEIYIKYRTCVIEHRYPDGEETFLIPRTPGLVRLEACKFHRGSFYTRPILIECDSELLNSDRHFERWIKVRNIFFVDAMLFIVQRGKTFRLYQTKGPMYFPIQNETYYSLNHQVRSKE